MVKKLSESNWLLDDDNDDDDSVAYGMFTKNMIINDRTKNVRKKLVENDISELRKEFTNEIDSDQTKEF